MPSSPPVDLPSDGIEARILYIRGQKVMLDADLAELYGVSTKRLNEQVRRNLALPAGLHVCSNGSGVCDLEVAICDLKIRVETLGLGRPAYRGTLSPTPFRT